MNNKVANVISFLLGAAVGSVVTWKLLEKKIDQKYAQLADEEIASVKAKYTYKKPEEEQTDTQPEEPQEEVKEAEETDAKPLNIKDYYASKIKEAGYEDYSAMMEKGVEEDMKKPYVIAPEEFGEEDGYDTVSLTYYADGVLTDELDKVVKDVDKLVGKDSLTHFGEYEDDSVFVRNEKQKCDYEILRDCRSYRDLED
jgi:hypothetical protein